MHIHVYAVYIKARRQIKNQGLANLGRILNNDNFEVGLVKGNGENSPTEPGEDPDSQGCHKEEKVLVVSLPYTVIDPRTVVVKAL